MIDGRVRWLRREIPEWVAEGLLSPESAEAIRRHYATRAGGLGRSLALIAFGVLGATLIGSGLILLIAHNWDSLSQPARAGLALGLLVVAQALCAFAVLRRSESTAWRESTAAFLVLGIGASMGLVSQTYNVLTDVQDFMLRWVLLALPVVYLTRSRIAAALYGVGLFWATAEGLGWGDRGWVLWGLIALIVPYLVMLARERTDGGRSLVFWSLGLSIPAASAFVVGDVLPGAWMVAMSALFAGMFAIGLRLDREGESAWHRPLPIIGALGATGVLLALTFREVWRHADLSLPAAGEPWTGTASTWALTALLLGGSLWLAARSAAAREWMRTAFYALPTVAAAGFAVALGGGEPWAPAVLANLAVFALGLVALLRGIAGERLLQANAGMGLLAALFFFRFVDADLTLVLRGVGFIVIGTAFLAMNVKLLKGRREVRP